MRPGVLAGLGEPVFRKRNVILNWNASAQEFAKHGASGFVLHYLGDTTTESEVLSLKQEIETDNVRVVIIPGDIADSATSAKVLLTHYHVASCEPLFQIVEAGTAAFGRIDVLVSNAGICPFAEFLTMPHATWERTRQVNLDGSFFIVQGNYSTCPGRGLAC